MTLKLTTTNAPAEGTMLRGGPPIIQGCNRLPNLNFCGTLNRAHSRVVGRDAFHCVPICVPGASRQQRCSVKARRVRPDHINRNHHRVRREDRVAEAGPGRLTHIGRELQLIRFPRRRAPG